MKRLLPPSRYPFLLMAVSLLLLSACTRSGTDLMHPHYRIALELEPAEQHLAAEATFSFRTREEGQLEASFLLHRQLEVTGIESDLLAEYAIDDETPSGVPWMPEARWLNLTFSRPLVQGEQIDITFTYEGAITEWPPYLANVLTPEWVELGLYLPWFPIDPASDDFTFELAIACDPAYEVRGYGPAERRSENWVFSQSMPVNDIVVAAARDLKTHTRSGENLQARVHYLSVTDSTATLVGEDLFRAVEFFEARFGSMGREQVSLIVSPRESGGGYTRPGLIVLGGLSDTAYAANREAYMRYIAHESAHLWWHFASPESWHDWLNEGLAEFSALLAVREYFGDDAFHARLERKRANSTGTPPLWGFDRSDSSTPEKAAIIQHNLYDKGPLLLYELYQRLGADPFSELCRRMVAEQTATTQALLELVTDIGDSDTATWFEAELRTR